MPGSCLASCEWQTPLVIRFYLNISYGRLKVNFHLREEVITCPQKKLVRTYTPKKGKFLPATCYI
jgi:hypothetical protein